VTSVPISELWTPISKGKGKNSKKWCYIQLIMTTKIVFMCSNAERFRVEMTCHSRKKEKKKQKELGKKYFLLVLTSGVFVGTGAHTRSIHDPPDRFSTLL
jgi:hypothetical protein